MSFYNYMFSSIDFCTQQESSKRRSVFFGNIFPRPSVGRGLYTPIPKKTDFSTFLCAKTVKRWATSSSPNSLHPLETCKARSTQRFLHSFSNQFIKLLKRPKNLILGSSSLHALKAVCHFASAMSEKNLQPSLESTKSVTARTIGNVKSPILAAALNNKTVKIGLSKIPIPGNFQAYKPKLIT